MRRYTGPFRERVVGSFTRHQTALNDMTRTTADRVAGQTYDKTALDAAKKAHAAAVEHFHALGPALDALEHPDVTFVARRKRLNERLANAQRDRALLQNSDNPPPGALSWRGHANTVRELDTHVSELQALFGAYPKQVAAIRGRHFDGFVEHFEDIEANDVHVPLHGAPPPPAKQKRRGGAAAAQLDQRLVAFDQPVRGTLANAVFSAPD